MPFCSTFASALARKSSSLTRRAASSSVSIFTASRTFILRSFFLAPPRFWNMPCICWVSSSMPGGANISMCACGEDTSTSMSLSSSSPSRSFLRNFCRVADSSSPPVFPERPASPGSNGPAARPREEDVEHPLLGGVLGAAAHFFHRRLARVLDRDLGEVAHDRVDVASYIADLGELGRLDLDERRIGEPREAPRDLGLADAGGSDHEDVLGRDLLPQGLGHLLAAPSVPEGDRHGALGARLADDVLVELVNDFLGSHVRHGEKPCSPGLFIPAPRRSGSGWCRCKDRRRSTATCGRCSPRRASCFREARARPPGRRDRPR